ncbi:MAG: chemotaxis protein CheZ [Rhodospirillales bacterium]|nr:chemotaxis protein CheZ [Rhodospirillales bacterium]
MARFSAVRPVADDGFDKRLAEVRGGPTMVAESAEIERVVTSVLTSLTGGVTLGDLQLYREVEALGEYIQTARHEIAELRPDDIRDQHLPMATDELDAVVNATAEATGIILEAMETLEALSPQLSGEMAATVQDLVIKVYEACGFQDITGQRISKVVKTLNHIEAKIDALLAVFGADLLKRAPRIYVPAPGDEAGLLNGPALPSNAANSQADIDALLASFD